MLMYKLLKPKCRKDLKFIKIFQRRINPIMQHAIINNKMPSSNNNLFSVQKLGKAHS